MTSFNELGLPSELLHVLEQQGLATPTPIQAKAIPLALAGRDLVASAQTGTGKTLAFALPLVTRLLANPEGSAVVLVPTRELASQVLAVLEPLLRAAKLAQPCLLIGGVAFGPQFLAISRRPRVIVATPGRLLDLFKSGKLRVNSIQTLVLDEADRMLDMGFAPQVRAVLRHLPGQRQTLLFTATLPKDLKQLTQEFLRNPEQVFVDPPSTANRSVEQRMREVESGDKQSLLLEELNSEAGSVIVFTRTKRRTDKVAIYLKQYGVKVDRIHGDRSQAQRQGALDAFRSGRIRVLVATDIAARGLDIPQVALVVNFDLPEARDDYVHRIGRTGRAGADGEALSLVAPEEMRHWGFLSGDGRGRPSMPKRPDQQQGGGFRKGRGDGRPMGPKDRTERFEQYDRETGGGMRSRPRAEGGERSGGGFRDGGRPARSGGGGAARGGPGRRTFGGGAPGKRKAFSPAKA